MPRNFENNAYTVVKNCPLSKSTQGTVDDSRDYLPPESELIRNYAGGENQAFLRVLNEGTIAFERMGLDDDFKSLDLVSLARQVLNKPDAMDSNHLNLQKILGWSGGENVHRSPVEIEEHFGFSMNALNKGTESCKELFV